MRSITRAALAAVLVGCAASVFAEAPTETNQQVLDLVRSELASAQFTEAQADSDLDRRLQIARLDFHRGEGDAARTALLEVEPLIGEIPVALDEGKINQPERRWLQASPEAHTNA